MCRASGCAATASGSGTRPTTSPRTASAGSSPSPNWPARPPRTGRNTAAPSHGPPADAVTPEREEAPLSAVTHHPREEHVMFENADLIHRYTRADALADGVLIDVSQTAREAGFRYPVALTAAAWAKCVAVPPGVRCQDESGRLWDVLTVLRCAIRGPRRAARAVRFGVCVRNDNRERPPPLVRLRAVCGSGDDAGPVITVMLPGED